MRRTILFARPIYFVFLSLLCAIIALTSYYGGVISEVGLRVASDLPGVLITLLGVPAGVILSYIDPKVTEILSKALYSGHDLNRMVERQETVLRNVIKPSYMAILVGISFCEEFLWRGYLTFVLLNIFSFTLVVSILLTSLVFALTHRYYGFHAVPSKFIDGIIFGFLYVATFSVLAPFMAHVTYNFAIQRQSREALELLDKDRKREYAP